MTGDVIHIKKKKVTESERTTEKQKARGCKKN